MQVVVVSDTHLPRFGRALPPVLARGLESADLILHAGDLAQAFVLDLLGEFAPVVAIAGNNDPPELAERLGTQRIVDVGGVRIGLTHGHLGPGRTTPERAWRLFATEDPPLDAICFGHSHIPLVSQRDGVWLLNPGSPTDKRRQPTYSYLRIEIEDGMLQPHLVTFAR